MEFKEEERGRKKKIEQEGRNRGRRRKNNEYSIQKENQECCKKNTSKVPSIKEKTEKLVLMKNSFFCSVKDTIKRIRQIVTLIILLEKHEIMYPFRKS